MTAEVVPFRCRFEGCPKAASYPGQSRCEEHRLRFVVAPPEPPRRPAWVERMSKNAKDFTGSAA